MMLITNYSVKSSDKKKVGSTTYLFSLKLTNLTKPKLMKKNVLQICTLDSKKSEINCKMILNLL